MPRHEIVISAENNHYLGWQAMLFHFSCVKHLRQPPIVMVHTDGEPLIPAFERIRAAGGIVQTAPNYHHWNGLSYAPRNTAGSLRHVQTDADFIVLCDPDMLFLQPLSLDELTLGERQISFDHCGYLDPDADVYQPTLDNVCRQAGLDPARLRQPIVDGGVPHVIPAQWRQPLADLWLELIELFPTIGSAERGEPRKDWLATMWAVLMAAHRLNLEPILTRLCVTNFSEDSPLPPLEPSGPKMLHYCYGQSGFNKRAFDTAESADQVWHVCVGDETIAGAIRQQLHEAREFFGLPGTATSGFVSVEQKA